MRFVRPHSPVQRRQFAYSGLFLILLVSSLFSPFTWTGRSQAQTSPYCQLSADAIAEKNELREQALGAIARPKIATKTC
ncbi:MAG: hypothetical protein HC833_25730 [Leptolyngbyaceae cyanobacterium RM1_406_9]|nr:hypothetical protein [Leptolyngbyaceae cyanobacterium RM1_406_9]